MIAAQFMNEASSRGPLEGFTHMGVCGEPGNGAFVQFWLIVRGDHIIERCHYSTHGCLWSIACAGACSQLVTGRLVSKALLLEPKDIDLVLGGIPDGKGDCADMAVRALKEALGGYLENGSV